jgi:hypothetical protein
LHPAARAAAIAPGLGAIFAVVWPNSEQARATEEARKQPFAGISRRRRW